MSGWWNIRSKQTTGATPARRRVADNMDRSHDVNTEKERYDAKSRLFSRNRTLLRREDQKEDGSPRATSHQLRRKQRSLGWFLVMTLAIVSVFGIIVYQLTAEVTVSLRGSLDVLNNASQVSYKKTLDDYFAKHPLERFRGLMDPGAAATYLQQHGHNEISGISKIEFQSIGKTLLVLEAREPVARWIIDKNVQFVDKRGSTFTKNYYTSPHIKIIDQSGVTIGDSQTATSGRFLGFIGKSIGALEARGHLVSEVIIPPATTRQIQLRVTNNVLVKMAIDRPVGEQAEDAAESLGYLAARNLHAEYVDVRVTGKAYYR